VTDPSAGERSLNSAWTQEECDDRANQEYDKKNFGNSGGARRNSTKSKYGGNDRDNQKNGGIVQHKNPLYQVVISKIFSANPTRDPARW
jgi:hypothetical protein